MSLTHLFVVHTPPFLLPLRSSCLFTYGVHLVPHSDIAEFHGLLDARDALRVVSLASAAGAADGSEVSSCRAAREAREDHTRGRDGLIESLCVARDL